VVLREAKMSNKISFSKTYQDVKRKILGLIFRKRGAQASNPKKELLKESLGLKKKPSGMAEAIVKAIQEAAKRGETAPGWIDNRRPPENPW
jgi:hypothetical protein